MKLRTALIFLATGVLLTGCAPAIIKQTNPELLSPDTRIKKVAVLPPAASVTSSQVTGDTELFELADEINQMMVEILADLLPLYGFEVVDNGLTHDILADDDVKYELELLMDSFRTIEISFAYAPDTSAGYQVSDERIEDGEMSIGDDVIPFARDAGADGLVFVEAGGVVHSGGKQALGALAGIYYISAMRYAVMLVDGADGTVMTAFIGQIPLDGFTYSSAKPGGERYGEMLDRLRYMLEEDITRQLDQALLSEEYDEDM